MTSFSGRDIIMSSLYNSRLWYILSSMVCIQLFYVGYNLAYRNTIFIHKVLDSTEPVNVTALLYPPKFINIAINSTDEHKDVLDMSDPIVKASLQNISSHRGLEVLQPIRVRDNVEQQEFYRLHPHKVSRYIYNFTISADICDSDTHMITLIHSWHKYADRREAIRKTWGQAVNGQGWPYSDVTHKQKMLFVFGTHPNKIENQKIQNESYKYGDIIQGSFREDYKNMTLKSLLGLKWVATHCPHVKYILKSDDDMLINIPYLLELLDNQPLERTIIGPYCPHSKVLRSGKWGLKREQFPFKYFPPYFAGSCYIITADLSSDLYEVSEYVPHIHIDDVYITGILSNILNITMMTKTGFAYANTKPVSTCEFLKKPVIASTKMTPLRLKTFWKDVESRINCSSTEKQQS